jgi:hypothetical protein
VRAPLLALIKTIKPKKSATVAPSAAELSLHRPQADSRMSSKEIEEAGVRRPRLLQVD